MDEAPRTAEGRLIDRYIKNTRRSLRSVAREVPISDTRLRQWIAGSDAQGDVVIPARQLARLAQVLDIPAKSLASVGRDDASEVLDEELGEGQILKTAAGLTMEEIARQLAQMSKRLGNLEHENNELKTEVEELRDMVDDD